MRKSSRSPSTARPVLVAVDNSSPSTHALAWAAHEAISRNVGLRIVHACALQPMWDPTGIVQWAPEQFRVRDHALSILGAAEEFVRTITPDIEVGAVLRIGSPERVIRAEGKRASLTVMGRGRGQSWSVISHVIARSTSPVSVVGSADSTGPCPSASRVVALLLPGQQTSSATAVLQVALSTARRHAWPVTIVADWSEVWHAGLAEAMLRVRARMAGDVDVETAAVPVPGSTLPPVECLSEAVVVLAPHRRPRSIPGPPCAFGLLHSSGASATFVPRPHGRRTLPV